MIKSKITKVEPKGINYPCLMEEGTFKPFTDVLELSNE